jgi:peptidoglycan/LPS O-acetylase OafA/YrhL
LLHTLGIFFTSKLLTVATFQPSGLPISVTIIVVTLASVLVTTPAAYLSWRFIEISFINLGRNIGRAPGSLRSARV